MNRSRLPRLYASGLLAAAALAFTPGQVLAQVAECNAQISVDTAEDVLFFLNEPIGIAMSLGAGTVTGGTGDPPNYLDISQFTYQLDCQEGETYPNCTPANNTVVFDPNMAGVTTNCVDENGDDIVFDTSVVNGEVIFTPTPGTYIRNYSEMTCDVAFDIMVRFIHRRIVLFNYHSLIVRMVYKGVQIRPHLSFNAPLLVIPIAHPTAIRIDAGDQFAVARACLGLVAVGSC